MEDKKSIFIMKGKTYDILTWIGQIVIPALGVLYAAIAEQWGLPFGDKVAATAAAIAFFMNSILKYCRAQYYKTNENVSGTDSD